jgi:hypothetical protein
MTLVSRSFSLTSLQRDFDILLNEFRSLRDKSGKGAPIESTKLWGYRKKLNSESLKGDMNPLDLAALIGVVGKYCSLIPLLNSDRQINISEQKLLELLEGKHLLNDRDERYNDVFFELSMALRFLKSMPEHGEIDLSTECDVVVHNRYLAIECKYIHSEKKFRSEFSDAMNQLESRINNGIAQYGIVAYDLSNLIDHQEIFKFSRLIFDKFLKNYECLIESRSIISKDLREAGVLKSVVQDRNFFSVVNHFASHQAETIFYRNFKKSELEKFSDTKVAVIFQWSTYLLFEHEYEVIPVPYRGLTYYINKELPGDRYESIQRIIKSLASGI